MIPIVEMKKGDPLPSRLLVREDAQDVTPAVKAIIAAVREKGDEALLDYTLQFDKVDLRKSGLRVTEQEIAQAKEQVSAEFLAAMAKARQRIYDFHKKQKRETWMDFQPDMSLGQMIRPLDSVGLYVPGGTAPLSSSVLMNAMPAVVAGVERIVMATPPRSDGSVSPAILAAADACGIREIYKVGGAQAIAALAYGTAAIAPVDKIVGPGNAYVATAKREVFGKVGIDMIAGPSEVLVIADESANAHWVAADLLSQAEHDVNAAAILVTPSKALADGVQEALKSQLASLPRRKIAEKSLQTCGTILLVEDLAQAVEFSNKVAPEHLELSVADPFALLPLVRHAGACFLGHYSPESLGDYFAGPNHVLPTNGTARFSSPLTVDDFIKKTSIIYSTADALASCTKEIGLLARAEELEAHARAAEWRMKGAKA